MKRYFKKIYFPIILATAVPAFAFISCSNSKKMELPAYNNNFAESVWENANAWAIATVVSWSDGDTLIVDMKIEDQGETTRARIRVQGIDTPENGTGSDTSWTPATALERSYAKAASDFAKSIIPIGSKVKIWLPGNKGQTTTDSYGRPVGSIFYGDNYSKNFSVEMIRQGWSLPEMEINKIGEYYAPEFVLAEQAAIGFNLAWNEKKGIHKDRNDKNFSYLSEIYKMRGVDSAKAIFFISTDHPAHDSENNYWIKKEKDLL